MPAKLWVVLWVALFIDLAVTGKLEAAQKEYYLKANPILVTNYLAGPTSFIVQPYVHLPTKQALKQVCPWMPRIQDAFMSALNTYNKRPRLKRPATEKEIGQVLAQAIKQVTPLKLPLTVRVFAQTSNKSRRQEQKLRVKLKCK